MSARGGAGRSQTVTVSLTSPFKASRRGHTFISASVFVGSEEAGEITASLVRRNGAADFHRLCDEESADLADTSVKFCNARGQPCLTEVRATGPEAASGGFLYVRSLDLLDKFRQPAAETYTDVGSAALHALLARRWQGNLH